MQRALSTVSQAIKPLRKGKHISWILDSGFDDIAVGRTIWQEQDHVVCRVYHTNRQVEFCDRAGQWQQGDIAQACLHLRPVARAETSLEVQRGKQPHPKKQPVVVELAACPLRLSYASNVRRPGGKERLMTKRVWLVQVHLTLEWAEVQLLAKLGGWVPHKGRAPGKITLMRGVRRLLDKLATQAIRSFAAAQAGGLPPKIRALLHGWQPPPPEL